MKEISLPSLFHSLGHTLSFKSVSKHTAVYGISSSLNRAAGFFLIPVYTRFLQPEEYGLLALCQVLIGLLTIFYGLGINSSVFRYYFEYDNKTEKDSLIGTSILFLLFSNFVFTLFIITFSSWFSRSFLDTATHSHIIEIIAIAVFVGNILQIPFMILRANNLSLYYSLLSLIKLILSIGLNILFVVYLKRSILGIMESHLITASVLLLVFLPYLLRNVKFRFSLTMFKELCRFGLPLIPTNLIGFLLAFSDRYILKMFVSFHEIGIYSLGYKFGAIVNMIGVSAIALAWPTALMNIIKDKGANIQIAKTCTYFMGLISCLVLFLSIFIDEILTLVATEKYMGAGPIVPVIAFAYLFFAYYKLFESGIFIVKRTVYYPFIIGIAAVINIGLNLLLVPVWGMAAAAYNTVVGYGVLSLLTLYIAQRLYRIPYEYKRLLSMTFLSLVLIVSSRIINIDSILAAVVIKSILFLSFPCILFVSGFFTSDEVVKMKQYKSLMLQKISIP